MYKGEGEGPETPPNDTSYALTGKIMLSAIVILFFVVILMVCLHLYARWYLLRASRVRRRRNGRNRRTHLVFYVDPTNPNPTVTVTRGLDAAVLKSLPVFTYSSKTHPDSSLECAVCLSEFEENESGRVLPKCNHSFHLDCIDMWFHSHSTCPLCRSTVEPGPVRPENTNTNTNDAVVLTVVEPGSSSELCGECQHEEEGQVGTSSFGGRRKPMELDVPRRNIEDFENESTRCDSPASQSFKSPMSRMLSFTRILSRDRRSNLSPSSANLASCGGSVTELDIERGRDETQQIHG